MRLRHAAFVASFAAALFAVSACGSTEPQNIPIEQTVFADTLHIDLPTFTKLSSGMYIKDNIIGGGAVFTSQHSVSVRYSGYLANGSLFDSNVNRTTPFTFTLGAGQVIPGWDIGLQGMKVGGRRTLIIPPELAYGYAGNGPIPPYAVLVFTVDAISTT